MSKSKIVVTKSLIRNVIALAEQRYIAKRKKDPKATLTQCRDSYWKLYTHWYQRVGKAFAIYGAELDASANLDYTAWLSGLSETELQGYLNKLRDYYLGKKKVLTQDTRNATADGSKELEEDNLADGNGLVVDAQTLDDLQVPSGFVDPNQPPPGFGLFNNPHIVDTSSQNQLAARVKEALLSVTRNRVVFNREDGDLTQNRFSDIAQGTNLSGLYHQRTNGHALRVACQIYIDLSGSMLGEVKDQTTGQAYEEYNVRVSRFTLVERLCYALGNTLEQLRIPYQIIGFNDWSVLLKDYSGRVVGSPLNTFAIDSDAGTHLGTSLSLGFPMLAHRREPRKVAFILTDGDVGNVQTVLESYSQIETCAFGIGCAIPEKAPFRYRVEHLGGNLIEQVATSIASVLVRKA